MREQPPSQQRVWVCGRPGHRPARLAITAVHISMPRPKGGRLTRSNVPLPITHLSTKPSQLQIPFGWLHGPATLCLRRACTS